MTLSSIGFWLFKGSIPARVPNQSAHRSASRSSGCTSGSSGIRKTISPGVRIVLVALLQRQIARRQRSKKLLQWFVSVFIIRICSVVLKQFSGRWKTLGPSRYRRSGRSTGFSLKTNSRIEERVDTKPRGRHTPFYHQRCQTRPIKPIWLVRAT